MHSLQMYTPGPATNRLACSCFRPQKEHCSGARCIGLVPMAARYAPLSVHVNVSLTRTAVRPYGSYMDDFALSEIERFIGQLKAGSLPRGEVPAAYAAIEALRAR